MELTIALERYDRHMPFFMGSVPLADGVTLQPLEVGEAAPKRDGGDRHKRMLHNLEFDICEMSLTSYIIAKGRDPDLGLIALPSFPRRLFSQSNIYVNAKAGIKGPKDLAGKRIGIQGFQVTLPVLAKGDLKFDYGFDWRTADWICMRPENIPITFPEGVDIRLKPKDVTLGAMLHAGEIDALILSHVDPALLADGTVAPMFADSRAEEEAHYQRHGYWPVMHLMVMRTALAGERPDLPRAVMAACDEARRQARNYYEDAGYSMMAWARQEMAHQRALMGEDPYPQGLAANRANLERFIGYCHDQTLIPEELPVEALFHSSTLDS